MVYSKIILALDGLPIKRAVEIAKMTSGLVWGYKMNDLLVDEGLEGVPKIAEWGQIMLDPKTFDIPETMTNNAVKYKNKGVQIVTVHARAKYKAPEHVRDMIAGVTVLTSEHVEDFEEDIKACIPFNSLGEYDLLPDIIERLVVHYAGKVQSYQYGYLVCSAQMVSKLKHITVKKICPAIRPKWSIVQGDDQNPDLIATPRQAILNGADLLVIGRPILRANDILEAIYKTNSEIDDAVMEQMK